MRDEINTVPLIGITTHGLNEKGSFHIPGTYIACIRRSGGIPVLISPGERRCEELAMYLDGFVFTGGGDIDPSRYSGKTHESIYGVDEIRDRTEFELARIVLRDKIPTLAICRGLQVFTVALGGTLKDDILNIPGSVIHRLPDLKPSSHTVIIKENSRLNRIVGIKELICASVHHQAVDKLPPETRIAAHAEDGIIEALDFENRDHLMAVQWHPEITAGEDRHQQALFDTLIAWAGQYQLEKEKSQKG